MGSAGGAGGAGRAGSSHVDVYALVHVVRVLVRVHVVCTARTHACACGMCMWHVRAHAHVHVHVVMRLRTCACACARLHAASGFRVGRAGGEEGRIRWGKRRRPKRVGIVAGRPAGVAGDMCWRFGYVWDRSAGTTARTVR